MTRGPFQPKAFCDSIMESLVSDRKPGDMVVSLDHRSVVVTRGCLIPGDFHHVECYQL